MTRIPYCLLYFHSNDMIRLFMKKVIAINIIATQINTVVSNWLSTHFLAN